MADTILTLVEINLLLNSEEPKNTQLYGNLYSVLQNIKNPKAVSLESLPVLDTKARNALLRNKKNLFDATVKEWRATTTINERPKRDLVCQLCNTPIKYLCYIFNFKNNTELRVGSECIKKFSNMEGYTQHKEQLQGIHRNQKIVLRRNKFYDIFPNCENDIKQAEKYFSTLPILLPHDMYFTLESVISRMSLIYNKYVNEGKKPFNSNKDSFELFELALIQYNKVKSQAEEFLTHNINNPLICRRREIDWLRSQNKLGLLKEISNSDGRYTLATLKHMYNPVFVREHTKVFSSKNKSKHLKIDKISDSKVFFTFNKLGYQPAISLSIIIKDFMYYIGAECILNDEYEYRIKNIIPIISIENTMLNIQSIINYNYNITNSFNCVFLIDYTTRMLILYRRWDKSIRILKPESFLNLYNKCIFTTDENINRQISNIVKGNQNTKWISYETQEKQGIEDKVGRLYREQYLDGVH